MKKAAWTPYSRQRAQKAEFLRRQLADNEKQQEFMKQRLGAFEKDKARILERSNLISDWHANQSLSACLEQIEDKGRKLTALQGRAKELRAEIEGLASLPPAEAAKRRAEQSQLIGFAVYRRTLDAKIEKALQPLRKLLQKREKVTVEMRTLADFLEFTGDLDRTRFDILLSSLPESVAPISEEWTARLLGKGRKPYVVCDLELTLPETLASLGLHKRGDTVFLTEGEAADLLRSDRPKAGGVEPWESLPPSIVTPQAFKRVTADAAKFNTDTFSILAGEHSERERQRREEYEKARQGAESSAPASRKDWQARIIANAVPV